MIKLSLSMIVKNEEQYLRGCLESIEDIADEIIIVDTGSTDKTLDIAKEFNAEIYQFNWVNDFSAARNFALSKSKGNWILYLDADERLTEKSKRKLNKIIDSNYKIGVKCKVKSKNSYQNSSQMMNYVRLFKNSSNIKFEGMAHEQIEPSLIENQFQIVDSSIEIIHLGYDVPDEELQIKAQRNLDLMVIEYAEKPTSYLAFQIGNSYKILNQNNESVKFFKEALNDSKLRREFKSVCYLNLADEEMRKGNLDEAKRLIDSGLKLDINHILLNMLAAQIYKNLKNQSIAINYCKKALEENRKSKLLKNSNNLMDITIDDLKIIKEGILISVEFESQNTMIFFLREMKKLDENFLKIISSIIYNELTDNSNLSRLKSFTNQYNLEYILNLLKYNSNNEAKLDFLSSLYDKFNSNTHYLTNFGVFLLSINQFEEAKLLFEMAMKKSDYDDSIIFYLISIYTSINEKRKIKNLIDKLESRAKNNHVLYERLNILKIKLKPILNQS